MCRPDHRQIPSTERTRTPRPDYRALQPSERVTGLDKTPQAPLLSSSTTRRDIQKEPARTAARTDARTDIQQDIKTRVITLLAELAEQEEALRRSDALDENVFAKEAVMRVAHMLQVKRIPNLLDKEAINNAVIRVRNELLKRIFNSDHMAMMRARKPDIFRG